MSPYTLADFVEYATTVLDLVQSGYSDLPSALETLAEALTYVTEGSK